MQRTFSRLRLIGGLSGTIALLTGGCPIEGAFPQAGAPTPPPGRYWIAERGGQLYYFDLPEQRGQSGQWTALPAGARPTQPWDAADDALSLADPQASADPQAGTVPLPPGYPWFLGDGLYELGEDLTWTLIEAAVSPDGAAGADLVTGAEAMDRISLDEILQLHDPPPRH